VSALERLRGILGEGPYRVVPTRDAATPCLEVERAELRELARRLRDECGFESNTFVTAIDRLPARPRFEVDYQLLSISAGDRVRVRVLLDEDDAWVPSIADLWPGAAFSERECFDMFGVRFEGHPKLERLLMPAGYEHHPLRKDFPHHGIEPDRLYREWERGRARGAS